MIKIRYHHLMCIPRYKGNGYSKDFCANLEKIKNEIENKNYILTDECDDICACCPNRKNSKCKSEQKVKAYDLAVKSALEKGKNPRPEEICSDCQWFNICRQ